MIHSLMACCSSRPIVSTINHFRSRTFLLFHTRFSAKNQTAHLYPITTRLQCFHGVGNVAKEGLDHENNTPEAHYLSCNLFKPLSAVGGLSTLNSSQCSKSNPLNTLRDKSWQANVTYSCCNVMPVNVTFLNTFQSLFHHQTIWNNSSIHKLSMVPTSGYSNISFRLNRMLHAGIIKKCLRGSCNNQNMSVKCYSTVGSQGSHENNDQLGKDRVSQEILDKVKNCLPNLVYQIFTGRHDYSILNKNVVLENNLFGKNKNSVGVLSYAVELLKIRLKVHSQFSGTFVEVKAIKILKQEGIIRIHWSLEAVSQTKVFNFLKLFKTQMGIRSEDILHLEAYSFFHIDKDGLVDKHSIHKVIPDVGE